jgi:hypothetical protein
LCQSAKASHCTKAVAVADGLLMSEDHDGGGFRGWRYYVLLPVYETIVALLHTSHTYLPHLLLFDGLRFCCRGSLVVKIKYKHLVLYSIDQDSTCAIFFFWRFYYSDKCQHC